jgi:regulatory protein
MLDEESKKARNSAIRYLAYRDRSRSEIVRHLKEKGFSGNSTDETIAFLEDNDYINDPRFAMQFGRSRIKNKKVGKLRLERELRDKGLKTSIIDLTLGSLYEEHNERELAMACAKKKFDSFSSSDIEKQRGRLARFLDRKGFHTSLVYQVVTQLVPHVTSNDFDPSPQLTKNQHHKTMTSCDQD